MDVHAGDGGLHRPDEVGVERDRQLRVDAALHAHLGGARLRRLDGPRGDLVQREPVRVGVALALGEGAEPAADVADVREVDVAVDDVGDLVADDVCGAGRPRRAPAPPARGPRRRISAIAASVCAGRAARPGARRPARSAGPDVGVQPLRGGAPGRGELLLQRRPSRRTPRRSRRAGPRCGPRCRWGACRSVAAGRGEPAVRLLPRAAHRDRGVLAASPVAGSASAATCACSRGVDPRRAGQRRTADTR